jgi:hypothetical protein
MRVAVSGLATTQSSGTVISIEHGSGGSVHMGGLDRFFYQGQLAIRLGYSITVK